MAFMKNYLSGLHAQQDRIETKRSEKSKAYREYVEAKVKAGETIDPYEMDRLRTSMAGGDPYLASYIPAGDALKEMINRANEQSRLNRMQIGNSIMEKQDLERQYVQKIVDSNWDKDEDQMLEVFGAAFGADSPRIYDRYKPELSSMLTEATGRKYASLSENPALKHVKDEADLLRFMPAEMRNPKTAAILKTMVADNKRQRSIDDVGTVGKILESTPQFVYQNPEMQKWWVDFAGQAMPGGPDALRQGMAGMSQQIQSERSAKLTELASKDPYFAAAAQTGDEDAMYAAIKSLMVQAGMPAPQSTTDPTYLSVKRELSLVSKTAAIATYNKREADLKGVAAEEAETIANKAGKRVEALLAGEFSSSAYGNGKSGKEAGIDDRITVAMNMIGTDAGFFPSEENLREAINFIRTEYSSDKQNFDPAAVAGRFMAEGNVENKAQWIDRRATATLEAEHKIKPGTNFTAWSGERTTMLRSAMTEAFDLISQPAASQQEYNAIVQSKAMTIQGLRTELRNITAVINTLNNDPASRSNVSNYDYNTALSTVQSLENSLRALESYNPQPPQVQAPTQSEPLIEGSSTYDNTMTIGGSANYPYRAPVETNAQSKLDTYLDVIADVESGGDPFAKAATSSATGLLQFTQGTWDEMVKRYGEQHGITRQDIYNPAAQRIMGGYLTLENANQLINQTGKEPSEKDLYLAHFLGPGRAATVINSQGSNLLAANLFPDAARANKNIFYEDGVPVTVEQLYKKLGSKIEKRMNKKG